MAGLELEVGGPAVGGEMVGRDGGGRVVFVAGALPGERVAVTVVDERRTFARAVVDQVLSREINPEVVATINALGGRARGFAGTDIFRCRRMTLPGPAGEALDIGYVGEVVSVNTAPLLDCIAQGITPVISPTALGEDGRDLRRVRRGRQGRQRLDGAPHLLALEEA